MSVNKILARAKCKMFFKAGIFVVFLMIAMISCDKENGSSVRKTKGEFEMKGKKYYYGDAYSYEFTNNTYPHINIMLIFDWYNDYGNWEYNHQRRLDSDEWLQHQPDASKTIKFVAEKPVKYTIKTYFGEQDGEVIFE